MTMMMVIMVMMMMMVMMVLLITNMVISMNFTTFMKKWGNQSLD